MGTVESDSLDVVGYDANGNFQVKLKTGDKEGSIYTYAKQPDGTFKLQPTGSSQYWDTNQWLLEDPMALAMILGVTWIGIGGAGASSGLWSDPLAVGAAGAGSAAGEGSLLGSGLTGAGDMLAGVGGLGGAAGEGALLGSGLGSAADMAAGVGGLGTAAGVGTAAGEGALLGSGLNSAKDMAAGVGAAAAKNGIGSLLGSLPDNMKWIAPLLLG